MIGMLELFANHAFVDLLVWLFSALFVFVILASSLNLTFG